MILEEELQEIPCNYEDNEASTLGMFIIENYLTTLHYSF
jgi:hypothetical protein